jgi:hypothetical protein
MQSQPSAVKHAIGHEIEKIDADLKSAGEEGVDSYALQRWLVGFDGNPDKAAQQLKGHATWVKGPKRTLTGKV